MMANCVLGLEYLLSWFPVCFIPLNHCLVLILTNTARFFSSKLPPGAPILPCHRGLWHSALSLPHCGLQRVKQHEMHQGAQ